MTPVLVRSCTGEKTSSDLAELFGVGRSTVYRALERAGGHTAGQGSRGEQV